MGAEPTPGLAPIHVGAPTAALLAEDVAAPRRAAMVALLASPPPLVSVGHLFADALAHRLRTMEGDLAQRQRHAMRPDDVQHAEAVAIALALMVAQGVPLQRGRLPSSTRPTRLEAIYNDSVLVMHRYWLWDGRHSAARLHLFPDASETYIHNHRSNFVSTNLGGAYEHATWRIDESAPGRYEICTRHRDGGLSEPQERPGSVTCDSKFWHPANHSYFLSSSRLHTVAVPKASSAQGTSPTLTLFYKDNTASDGTYMVRALSSPGDADAAAPVPPRVTTSSEVPVLDDKEADRVYAAMEACLRASAAALRLAGPLGAAPRPGP
jgi:hypothetical protein